MDNYYKLIQHTIDFNMSERVKVKYHFLSLRLNFSIDIKHKRRRKYPKEIIDKNVNSLSSKIIKCINAYCNETRICRCVK